MNLKKHFIIKYIFRKSNSKGGYYESIDTKSFPWYYRIHSLKSSLIITELDNSKEVGSKYIDTKLVKLHLYNSAGYNAAVGNKYIKLFWKEFWDKLGKRWLPIVVIIVTTMGIGLNYDQNNKAHNLEVEILKLNNRLDILDTQAMEVQKTNLKNDTIMSHE